LTCHDLGCSITLSSYHHATGRLLRTEAEICQFDVKAAIKQDVLGLDVQMIDPDRMHICYGVIQHVEICSGNLLRQSATATDQMGQLTMRRKLNNGDAAHLV
jgi:hypothetical protein